MIKFILLLISIIFGAYLADRVGINADFSILVILFHLNGILWMIEASK